jgi:hypothetical protein
LPALATHFDFLNSPAKAEEETQMGGYVGLAPGGFPNVALSQFAKEFADDAVPLVGDLIAPKVPVERQSFPYVIWNRDNLRVPGSVLRAPGASATEIRRSFSTDTYFCRSHALKGSVPDESEAFGLGLGFSERQHLTADLIGRIRRAREVEIATLALSTSNFPNGVTLSGNSQWDSYITTPANNTIATVTSHPILAVEGYKAILRQAAIQDTQMVLILSDPVSQALANHPDLIERFKYTNPTGNVSLDQMANAFGLEPGKVVRASALTMSANNTPSWIWGMSAFLGFSQANPGRNDVSCAKTFVWAGGQIPDGQGGTVSLPSAPGTIDGYGVVEWPDPERDKKTWWQAVDWYYGLKVTATETGIPILAAVASGNFPMGTIPGDIEG